MMGVMQGSAVMDQLLLDAEAVCGYLLGEGSVHASLSHVTGLSLVPGFALHDELVVWAKSGISTERILHLATQGMAKALGLPRHGSLDTAPEVLTATRVIRPETPLADILRSVEIFGEF